MNLTQYKEGKVYDPAQLRPFDLELAKQGHPLATNDGRDIRCLRANDVKETAYSFDFFTHNLWSCGTVGKEKLGDFLRLAPLAVKEGKPLHVGDEIEIPSIALIRTVTEKDTGKDGINPYWRWPAEVKA